MCVLAYPEIKPPHKLLAKGLLYADKFGSLSPALFDEGLAYAYDKELYEPVSPFGILDSNEEYLDLLMALSRQFGRANPDEWTDTLEESTLLSAKFPAEVVTALREAGVVTPLGAKKLLGAPEFVMATMSLTAHIVADIGGWVCDTTREDVYATTWLDRTAQAVPEPEQSVFRLQRTNYPIPSPRPTQELVDLRKRHAGLLADIRQVVDELNSPKLAWDFRAAKERQLRRLTIALGKVTGDHEDALHATGVTNLLVTIAGGLASPALANGLGDTASAVLVGLGSIGAALEMQRRQQNRGSLSILTSHTT